MPSDNLADLTERVRLVLKRSALKDLVSNVLIEPSVYEDDDVLRITLVVAQPEAVDTEAALKLIDRIRDELSELDERFPSVRFSEAA